MAAAQSAIAAGNFTAAGAALAPLASAGDAQAQYQWASLALDGRAVGLAPDRAISLLVQSAAQGNAHAQARLGKAYAQGDHVAIDKLAAYHWLSRAGTSPDLSDTEKEQVASLRKELLETLAPDQKYTPPAPGTASANSNSQKIPAADRAMAAPAGSISEMPLFSNATRPIASDDAADSASNDPGNGATVSDGDADSKQTSSARLNRPAKADTAAATAAMASAPPTAISTAASGKAYFVQLASLPTARAATTEADRLAKKYADILQGIDVGVRQADLGAKGLTQRVLAGPFDSLATAKDHCAQLSARKQECRVIALRQVTSN